MRIVVVKIGSSVLLTHRNILDEFLIAHVADQIITLREKNIGVVLIISGAVACGADFIRFTRRQTILKQLAAGIGQAYIVSVFRQIFLTKGLQTAQILLTKDLWEYPAKKKMIYALLQNYLKRGVVPIINENDVIDLNSFGGNDFLAAKVALLLNVERMLILSTMEGSRHGVGGGNAKRKVLQMLKREKTDAMIVEGKTHNILLRSFV